MSDSQQQPETRDPWAPPRQDRAPLAEPSAGRPRKDRWDGGRSNWHAVPPPPPAPGLPTGFAPVGSGSAYGPPQSEAWPGRPPYGQRRLAGPPGEPGAPDGFPGHPAHPGLPAGHPGYPGQAHAYGPWSGYPYPVGTLPAPPGNGFGTAALVLGIVGAVLGISVVFGIVLGVLAIIFGGIGRSKAARGEAANGGTALAGILLGVLALLVSVLMIVVTVTDRSGGYGGDGGDVGGDDPGYGDTYDAAPAVPVPARIRAHSGPAPVRAANVPASAGAASVTAALAGMRPYASAPGAPLATPTDTRPRAYAHTYTYVPVPVTTGRAATQPRPASQAAGVAASR
ncbi:DUF4190 domain-containing protein [Streptomyces sp. MST-110588]|uniref:DUF4190 domain-containing protein n=1 Tax=Streptomyces sp. MST-110588 TaxID=2833628 RepID=UPI001F5CCD14|nr:DUF4190 domain-containing protein [Streptomyces sp. MST-110588]UNO39682.1 hypothetical protein KGS77_08825 [Streptomyces sp. MST-110588]